MAARKRKGTSETGWPDATKEKIRGSMLLNRLDNHAHGKCDMTPTQIRAAEIVLKKIRPDLQSTALTDADGGKLPTTYTLNVNGVAKK